MTISVVIIAHNEQEFIQRCLQSILDQTNKATEIIVLAHNCTDKTAEIAWNFSGVRVVESTEDGGPIIARLRGIEAAQGEIICCIDGDCYADKDWIKNVSAPLIEDSSISLVAGYTKIQNNFYWKFVSWFQFVINRKFFNWKKQRFAWGSNMSFRKNDYTACGGLLPYLTLYKTLGINLWAEDLYLSLALQTLGRMHVALDANIFTATPSEKTDLSKQRIIVAQQNEDNKKLFEYFKNK